MPMFRLLVGLPSTGDCNNYADNCYYNTDNTYDRFCHHILYLSLYFPYVYLPCMEVLKMYSFWRKVNRLPFRIEARFWWLAANIRCIMNEELYAF